MDDIAVDVLIVGGGGCGLSASCFLSAHGVDHLLVERHPATSHLPKAHYLNQRTMEILRAYGFDEAVYAAGAPIENMGRIEWRTTLGGDGPLDDIVVQAMDAFGGGALRAVYERDSPSLGTNLPQLRLEPLLRAEAERRAPGRVRFDHDLVAFEQHDDGVRATILDRARDERFMVDARYVIGADGGKTLGAGLGVRMEGPTQMVDVVSAHFSADLSPWAHDETLITWFVNPEGRGAPATGALVKMGPTWDRHSEEWTAHLAFSPGTADDLDAASVVPRLRELFRLPDLEPEVHRVSHWILDRVVADRYRFGSVLLAGDAVHRQPPTTGLGLNSAIQDAHNLCWKLAAVVGGRAGAGLLDTYEAERRPVGLYNADWALLTHANLALVDAALGLRSGAPPAVNRQALLTFFSPTPVGRTLRARAAIAIGTQAVEFQAHDVEIGFRYEEGALVAEAGPAPERDPLGCTYVPTTRPGHRLPHAWVRRAGRRVSTHDLAAPAGFTLLAGADGEPWVRAAREVGAAFGIELAAYAVGGDVEDPDGAWAGLREVGDDGAVLVRPDQHVAWRSMGAAADPVAALSTALEVVLAHRSSVPARI